MKEFRAAAKTDVKALATAIIEEIINDNKVSIVAIGQAATYNAIKAYTIAKQKNIWRNELILTSEFIELYIDGNKKTALELIIYPAVKKVVKIG